VAIAKNGEVVDAAFVQALGRQELSEGAQHALVLAMTSMYMKVHDVCNDPSSAMMQASPLFLPLLLRVIAQEQPVATCRYYPRTPLIDVCSASMLWECICLNLFCSYEAIRSIGRFIFGKHGKTNAQKLPVGVPRLLVHVIDSDSDTDNRTCAMNCLNSMVIKAPATACRQRGCLLRSSRHS
jgi:hypothetical protein